MKVLSICCIMLCLKIAAFSQQPSFEGFIDYQVEVKSKASYLSDESARILTGFGNTLRIYIKKGRYYWISGKYEQYTGFEPRVDFIKYKGRDTIYNVPDTSYHPEKIQIKRNDKNSVIANYSCKSIRISEGSDTREFFYAPELSQNPDDNPNIKGTEFHRYVEETKSVWLKSVSESSVLSITYTAVRVQQQTVDEKLMQLPSLPKAQFNVVNFMESATLKSEKDWAAYIQRSVNAELANKYLKIPKGEKSVKQTVLVEFVITRTGAIGEVKVTNAKEVHTALAKEAVRVIKEAYGWKPATFMGQPIDGLARQPFTFISSY